MKEVLENDPAAYFVHDELLAPLKAMYGSLMDTGDDSIANGRLLDVMRQVWHLLMQPTCASSASFQPCCQVLPVAQKAAVSLMYE